jgi:hypothetical protein
MRKIHKGPQPTGLQVAAANLREDLVNRDDAAKRVRARTEFGDQRGQLVLGPVLEKAQRRLCVYCERRIGPSTVEHWQGVASSR